MLIYSELVSVQRIKAFGRTSKMAPQLLLRMKQDKVCYSAQVKFLVA